MNVTTTTKEDSAWWKRLLASSILIPVGIALLVLAALVDFASGVLSRLVDLLFLGGAGVVFWKIGGGWRSKIKSLREENKRLRLLVEEHNALSLNRRETDKVLR